MFVTLNVAPRQMTGIFYCPFPRFTMSEIEALLPYCDAALIALVVAFCRSTIANVPPTVKLRIFDAIVCAAGAVSVCVVVGNHFSQYMAHGDSVAVAFCFGYLGAGRLSDFAVQLAEKKFGGKAS